MASTTQSTAKTLPWYKTGKGLSGAGIGMVFVFAVYINAIHTVHVSLHYRQPNEVAYTIWAILDIFAFFCAIRLRSATSRIQKILNRVGMWSMLTMSLWFNIEYALLISVGMDGAFLTKSLLISGFVSGVVSLAAEILTHVRKTSPASKPKAASKAPSKAATAPTTPKVPAPRRSRSKAAAATTEPAIAS